jgi:17beta-estradiol 17-dehydrogenase / very-long-chain 3-oxoacyl-CoA reductase
MLIWLFDTICYIIGLHALALAIYYIASTLYLIFSSPFNLINRYGRGTWAVVTGASDGIGEGFCYELARDGFNVCLVSRSIEKLKRVEDNIKKINTNIQTKTVVADFKKGFNIEFFDHLMD